MLILSLEHPDRMFPGYDINTYGAIVTAGKMGFLVTSVIFMTPGTMLLMCWVSRSPSAASATACPC